jgi:hypothetical protein
MKYLFNSRYVLALIFVMCQLTSCKKDEVAAPLCKLSAIDRGNGNKHTYDANSIMTKRGFADLKGNKLFEVVLKPVGVVKSPEALLANGGLPYDVLTGFQWQVAEGGVGTTSEVFYDDNGKLVSDGISKITDVKTNSQGYLTESTIADATTKETQRFTLIDCN